MTFWRLLAWIAPAALLVGCSPSPAAIATAIAQTQSAWTPVPTQTPYPTHTPAPTYSSAPAVLVTVEVTRFVDRPVTVTPMPTAVPPTNVEPSSTSLASPTLPAFEPTVTPGPFTPLPPTAVIGHHVVQPGETIFCIARAYGVLPPAIAQANGLSQTLILSAGQVLQIPAAQWVDIAPGPVCAPQFASPFSGLPAPTATLALGAAPAAPPLATSLSFKCIANCGSKDGSYVVHVDVLTSGGVEPYTYDPAQSFDVNDLPHCVTGLGSVTVTSADGQTARATWTYIDTACP